MAQIQIKNPTTGFLATIDEAKLPDYQNIKTSTGVSNWEVVKPAANSAASDQPINIQPATPTNQISTDILKAPTENLIPEVKNRENVLTRIKDSYTKVGGDALANEAFIQAVSQYKYGRAASADELAKVGSNQYGLTGSKIKDVLGRFGLLDKMDGFGLDKPVTPQISPEKGSNLNETAKVEEQPMSALDKKMALVGAYGENKAAAKTEAMGKQGVTDIQKALTASQETANNILTRIETGKTVQGAEDILNEEAKISLKNKLEGQVIPMSEINKQLLSGMENLDQTQRLKRLYDTYDLNTQINLYNSQLRNVQLLQGQYQMAMDNVKSSVDDWAEEQNLKLQILTEQGNLEKEEKAKYESEIAYERGLMQEGYVYIDSPSAYNKIVKESGVTAGTFNQFFYKDPANGKIYLKPTPTVQGNWKVETDASGSQFMFDANTGQIKQVSIGNTGEIGGQCGKYINNIMGTSVGDTWESKQGITNTTPQDFAKAPQVGDVVVFKTKMPYGHIAAVTAVNGNQITLTESNWNGDEKIGTRTISTNDPTITGIYRGAAFKQQPANEYLLDKNGAPVKIEFNGKDYMVTKEGLPIQPDVPAETAQASELKQQAQQSAQDLLDKFKTGQGTSAVGRSRIFGLQYIPGSKAKDFEIQFNNLKSLLSLDNVKYLKGQGQVSDAERRLLAEASAKLDLAQSETEFKKSLEGIVKALSGIQTTDVDDGLSDEEAYQEYLKINNQK